MTTIQANITHIPIIQHIALEAWKTTYTEILSPEQFNYMVEMMYSTSALKKQMTELNHHFLLIQDPVTSIYLGFVSYEFNYKDNSTTKIHKLYLLPQSKGLGMGRMLVDKVVAEAQGANNNTISLNVNRNNQSLGFYRQVGFDIASEEDIHIGNGYLMEDYILEKKIQL